MEDNLRPAFKLGLHLHRQHAETSYILEGEMNFRIDGDWVLAQPGACNHVPWGVPHVVDVPEGGPAQMLIIFQPLGFDQYLAELANMAAISNSISLLSRGHQPSLFCC